MKAYQYRTSVEYSAPADVVGGRYYWTNTYIWESDYSHPPSDPSYNTINQACINAISEGCRRERWQCESWFGTGDVRIDAPFPADGHIPGADRVLLIDAVYASSGSLSSGYWYKRLRGCLGPSDVVGGRVSDYVLSWLQTYWADFLATIPLLNNNGAPVGAIELDSAVHGWQLRHGTKRSSRRVLQDFP